MKPTYMQPRSTLTPPLPPLKMNWGNLWLYSSTWELYNCPPLMTNGQWRPGSCKFQTGCHQSGSSYYNNDNTQISGNNDRFFKVRPLFNYLVTDFRREPETPISLLMRWWLPATWGSTYYIIHIICQGFQDGFIHDMILYQGQTTPEAHGVPLTPEQQVIGVTSQMVSVLLQPKNHLHRQLL